MAARRRVPLALAAAALAGIGVASPAPAANANELGPHVGLTHSGWEHAAAGADDQSRARVDLIVRVAAGSDGAERLRPLGRVEALAPGGLYRVRVRGPVTVAAARRAAGRVPGVRRTELDAPVRLAADARTDDPGAERQYYLGRIGWRAPAGVAPRVSAPGAVRVAILDSGLALDHPDLQGRVLAGYDAGRRGPLTGDQIGHGTAVTGVLAATTGNGLGIAGVAPGAALLVVRLGGPDMIPASAIVRGLAWAIARRARVINLSLTQSDPIAAITDQLDRATERGILVVAAAGNDGSAWGRNPLEYPAAEAHVVGVGATGPDGRWSGFSNHGPEVDVAAPGVDVFTTVPTGACEMCAPSGYLEVAGTSFSTPMVSGIAARLLAARPGLRGDQVAWLIRHTARDVGRRGRDDYVGAGVADLSRALAATPPAADPGEPNDDLERAAARPALLGHRSARRERVVARVTPSDDPTDVYRLPVRPGDRVTVTVTAARTVRLALLDGTARSLSSPAGRLAVRGPSRRGTASVVATASGGGSLRVGVLEAGGESAYTLTVSRRAGA